MQEVNEATLKSFVHAISHFFSQSSRSPMIVKSAHLAEPGQEPPRHQLTGLITISGNYTGCLCFSAPRGLLAQLLSEAGEPATNAEDQLDLVGEIANQLAGRARQQLGSELAISVPIRVERAEGPITPALSTRPYIIQLEWQHFPAMVMVHLAQTTN